ncbi:MAG: hypothetical protein VB144_13105 [Clostridia bacterium]|nr:hypothetical protein [Clostridia bacterium]
MLIVAGIALLPPLVTKRIVDDAILRGDLALLGKLAAWNSSSSDRQVT